MPEFLPANYLALALDVAATGHAFRRPERAGYWPGSCSVGPRESYVAERGELRVERDPAATTIHLYRNGRHAFGWDALDGRGLRIWHALHARFLNLKTPAVMEDHAHVHP